LFVKARANFPVVCDLGYFSYKNYVFQNFA